MQAFARTFGLTGGIASGKSTVAQMLQDLGARAMDADRIGHELIQPSLPAYREIVARFGPEILAPSGEIDRGRLAGLVFADPGKLRALNAILHPPILERVEQLAEGYLLADPRAVVVVEAALIYEAGLVERFQKVIVAWCRPEQQIERLIANTGLSPHAAEQRLAAQMASEEKRSRADYVIDTSGSKEDTRRQVQTLYPQLRRLSEQG